MSKDKIKESAKKSPASANRFRWGILFSVTMLFSIILFPNLIVTKHQYRLGDVAERDRRIGRPPGAAALKTNRQPLRIVSRRSQR